MAMHTRYQTKEGERLRKEKEAEMKKHGVQKPRRSAACSAGNNCNDESLYSQTFADDAVFGPMQ